MSKLEESLNNLYVNISLINNETIRDKSFEDLEIIRKELKALEIIKNKEIDVKDITETTDDYDLYVAYCEGKGYAKEYICDKEEFDLLKEVFENGYKTTFRNEPK